MDDLIHQKILNTKKIVYAIVEESFKELEINLKKSLAEFHEDTGLFSLSKTQQFEEELNSTLHEMY
jgi:hypothetical protein